MTQQTGPILALIDCAGDDAQVVAEAVWLARAAQAEVMLVHVAQPVPTGLPGSAESIDRAFRQIGLEQRAMAELHRLAADVSGAGVAVRVDDVYFGEAAAEVAYAADRLRASAVVAARRPARLSTLFAWRSRDVRLGRLLRVPLVLIEARSAEPSSLEPVAAFELEPDERVLVPASRAGETPAARPRDRSQRAA